MRNLSAAFVLGLVCLQSAWAQQPNILFVLVDDQRNDSLGCAGHLFIKTPHIDRLANEGTRFENMFVNTSICMASRATILTGVTQRSHGYRPGDPQGSAPISRKLLDGSFPTLLKKSGYYTGFFGKNHVSFVDGKSEAFDTMFDQWKHHGRNPYFKQMPDGSKRHTDEIMGDDSVAFLRNRPKDKPFFLNMNFNISHAEDRDHRPGIGHFPWPKAEDGLYEDIMPPRPHLDDPAIFENLPEFLKTSTNRSRYHWRWDTPEKYIVNMRAYYRMLTGMDRIVGRVLAELEKQGVAEHTIVIYSADNGYYMGDRGLAGKWSHFEQSLRVPLIIYDPRMPAEKRGRVLQPMASNLDIPATILEFAGLPAPSSYQGRSLRSILNGHVPADWRTSVFCEHHHLAAIPAWAGIRDERYVYARYDRQEPPYEFLHDLQRDPDQLINLVNQPEYNAVLERFRNETDAAIEQYTVPETVVALEKSRQSGKNSKKRGRKTRNGAS